MEYTEGKRLAKLYMWAIVLLLALVSLPFAIPVAKKWNVKSKAKASAAEQLIDPSSAQFRNVRVVKELSGYTVCGEINGKNKFGAYVGFSRFAASLGSPSIIEPRPSSGPVDDLTYLWRLNWSLASDKCEW